MNASTIAAPTALTSSADRSRPRLLRRSAVAVTGTVALALPTVWTVNIARLVLTGGEADHLYHQLTGQGLLLMALWLGALVPLVRAGWTGRRPGAAAGLHHLVFAAAVAGCAALAPAVARPIAAGGAVSSPSVADRLGAYFSGLAAVPGREAFPQLPDREREVLDLVARGYDNRRIARELFLSDKTVRNHVSNVLSKLDVDDRGEAAVRARNAGLGA